MSQRTVEAIARIIVEESCNAFRCFHRVCCSDSGVAATYLRSLVGYQDKSCVYSQHRREGERSVFAGQKKAPSIEG